MIIVDANTNRSDNRDEIICNQCVNNRRICGYNLSDIADILAAGKLLLYLQKSGILTADTNCF